MLRDEDMEILQHALAVPFDGAEVKFRPGATNGNRALALPYVDARCVMDRLDESVGALNWQDEYEFLPDGACTCKLRIRLGNEWITKMDVGGPSEQPDEGDRRKAAVSDALKRAAVKFGVGRYLYQLPQIWADYDPQRKRFVRPPTMPDSASVRQNAPVKTPPAPAKLANVYTAGVTFAEDAKYTTWGAWFLALAEFAKMQGVDGPTKLPKIKAVIQARLKAELPTPGNTPLDGPGRVRVANACRTVAVALSSITPKDN